MATPLSDEIRALIAYANETTEADDTKLGDCVKTLVDGYNGGSNVPSSPLVIPTGALSSRLASLLAYANETTGAGDTLVGDAIRTLCEGYGGGELIFYEKLVTDGVAWIITDYFPSAENTLGIRAKGNIPFNVTSGNNQGIYGCNSSSSVSAYRTFGQIAYLNGRAAVYAKNQTISNPYNLHTGTTVNDFDVNCYIDNDGLYHIESSINGTLVTYNPSSITRGGVATYGLGIFADNQRGEAKTHCGNGVSISYLEIKDAELGTLTYVPCTYNGEPGMWDLANQKFYGNAATSGQFTVEGEIVYYDYIKSPNNTSEGVGYIDTGIVPLCKDVKMPAKVQFKVKADVPYQNIYREVFSALSTGYGWACRHVASQYMVFFGSASNKSIRISASSNVEEWEFDFVNATYSNPRAQGSLETSVGTADQSNTIKIYARQIGIYSFKLIDTDGKDIIDLRPCTYNGEVGMWDMVGWEFYPSSDDGQFLVANDN